MGNTQSRQRFLEIAKEAYEIAKDLEEQFPCPRMRGAIVAYCEGRINSAQLAKYCTRLEVQCFLTSIGFSLSC